MSVALAPEVTDLTIYDRMCTAIAECARVDEAKDIRDKALALEAYYRQARNLDAEREAANVRLRAERRVGELSKELATAQGRRSDLPTQTLSTAETKSSTLSNLGITRQQASRYEALADIPKADFDRALAGPEKATTAGVLKYNEARAKVRDPAPAPRVSDAALWLWGRLRDFENGSYFQGDHVVLLRSMTDAMRADVLRIIPHMTQFLEELELAHEPA